jgi:ribosomal protein L28
MLAVLDMLRSLRRFKVDLRARHFRICNDASQNITLRVSATALRLLHGRRRFLKNKPPHKVRPTISIRGSRKGRKGNESWLGQLQCKRLSIRREARRGPRTTQTSAHLRRAAPCESQLPSRPSTGLEGASGSPSPPSSSPGAALPSPVDVTTQPRLCGPILIVTHFSTVVWSEERILPIY